MTLTHQYRADIDYIDTDINIDHIVADTDIDAEILTHLYLSTTVVHIKLINSLILDHYSSVSAKTNDLQNTSYRSNMKISCLNCPFHLTLRIRCLCKWGNVFEYETEMPFFMMIQVHVLVLFTIVLTKSPKFFYLIYFALPVKIVGSDDERHTGTSQRTKFRLERLSLERIYPPSIQVRRG